MMVLAHKGHVMEEGVVGPFYMRFGLSSVDDQLDPVWMNPIVGVHACLVRPWADLENKIAHKDVQKKVECYPCAISSCEPNLVCESAFGHESRRRYSHFADLFTDLFSTDLSIFFQLSQIFRSFGNRSFADLLADLSIFWEQTPSHPHTHPHNPRTPTSTRTRTHTHTHSRAHTLPTHTCRHTHSHTRDHTPHTLAQAHTPAQAPTHTRTHAPPPTHTRTHPHTTQEQTPPPQTLTRAPPPALPHTSPGARQARSRAGTPTRVASTCVLARFINAGARQKGVY